MSQLDNISNKIKGNVFIFPSYEPELRGIIRAAEKFAPDNEKEFVDSFINNFNEGDFEELSEDNWKRIENTDSHLISAGDVEKIEEIVNYLNHESRVFRDWRDLYEKIVSGREVDAPIVLNYDDKLHLIGGNVRLMLAKALEKKPDVLVVKVDKPKEVRENRKSFQDRLKGKLSDEEIEDIDFAYDLAKASHRTQFRKGGERYFEHPREGCLIMLDELKLFDRDLLVSFLLHDVGEDTSLLGNAIVSYDEFVKKAHFRLSKTFGEDVTDTVIRLTKPAVDNIRFKNKKETFDFYIEELKKSDMAIFCKMVDRLHNLRTLPKDNIEFSKKQIKETEEVYMSIFESVDGKYEENAKQLLQIIKGQLETLKNGAI